jgi:hypothetical protein
MYTILLFMPPNKQYYSDFLGSWYQCCGSRMFIPDPDFLPILDLGYRIQDPKTSTKESGEKN